MASSNSIVVAIADRVRRAAANLMTKDEARKIAAGIAKLPDLLGC
jgi:hypothetical protein